jgi:hypothetical protein
MTNVAICRLVFFAILAIGIALILIGAIITDFAPLQVDRWLFEQGARDLRVRTEVVRVLDQMNHGARLLLIGLGALLSAASVVGIRACRRRTPRDGKSQVDGMRIPVSTHHDPHRP